MKDQIEGESQGAEAGMEIELNNHRETEIAGIDHGSRSLIQVRALLGRMRVEQDTMGLGLQGLLARVVGIDSRLVQVGQRILRAAQSP